MITLMPKIMVTLLTKIMITLLTKIMITPSCPLPIMIILTGQELWMVAATYGFVSAFGQNIALIPTLTTGMKWFPRNKVRPS